MVSKGDVCIELWRYPQYCSSQCQNLRDRSNPNKDAEGKLSEVPPFEECPKWKALAEILEEIKEEGGAEDEMRVLILTSDERTAAQIQGLNSLHLQNYENTELRKSSCTWFGAGLVMFLCCSITALPGHAWVLLRYVLKRLFLSSVDSHKKALKGLKKSQEFVLCNHLFKSDFYD